MAKRWTQDEIYEWALYFTFQRRTQPEGRTLTAARQKLSPAFPTNTQLVHAASVGVMRHLAGISYKRDGDRLRFVNEATEAVFSPWKRQYNPAISEAARSGRERVCDLMGAP